MLTSPLLTHTEFTPCFFVLCFFRNRRVCKTLRGKRGPEKKWPQVRINSFWLTFMYLLPSRPAVITTRLFHWDWGLGYVTYQRPFISICYHFHWLRVSWRSVSLWPKTPERRWKQIRVAEQAVFLPELPACCLKYEAPWNQRNFLFHKSLNLPSRSCLFKTLRWLEIYLTQEESSWHSLASWCSHVAADLQSYALAPPGYVTAPSTVKTWRDYFSKHLLPFLHFESASCFSYAL